ncbi:MAG: hypothetical protein ABL879_07395 [Devosia sp.]
MAGPPVPTLRPPTPEELKRRRRNSIALGAILAILALIFYALTIAKMGPAVFNRDL